MKVKELIEVIAKLNGDMDVMVPSCADGDYRVDAKASVEQRPSGEKYLLIYE